jgi:NTP pyrophosphatase (non-canonical NTP hydrolase)
MSKIFNHVTNTWVGEVKPNIDVQFLHAALGLISESGELADHFKKAAFKPGFEIDREKVLGELGDVGYYWAVLCQLCGFSPDSVMRRNKEKLSGGKHGWKDKKTKLIDLNDGKEE